MRNRVMGLIAVLAFATVFSPAAFARTPQEAEGAAPARRNPAPPGPPHDPHDLNGVWIGPLGGGGGGAGSKANTSWSKTPVQMTAAGAAKMAANKPSGGPRAVLPAFGNDPMGGANPPGLVRTFSYANVGINAFEFDQLPAQVIQLFQWYHFWRQIWTDGSKLPADPDPWWYGHSVGAWDGDTFVVQTAGMDSRAWLDAWGTPFSDDLKIEERWHRADRDNLELTIKFDDPQTFAAPWVSDKRIFRFQQKGTRDAKLHEIIFAPMDEESFNERIRDPVAGVAKAPGK